MQFRVEPSRIALSLMTVAIVLVVAHVAGAVSSHVYHHQQVFGLVDTFDMNVENNVPTFFSAFILVAGAVLLTVIASQSTADRYAGNWKWLAIIFAFMAVDEDASLHELLIEPVRDLLPVAGPLFFAWVIPYALAVLVIGLLYLKFVWSLPVRTRGLFIGAGSLYLAGALGFESVGGWYFSLHGEIEDLPYSLLVAAEEFCEMSGIIVFIYALLDHLRDRLAGEPLRISISGS
jgi:hypothetical protein